MNHEEMLAQGVDELYAQEEKPFRDWEDFDDLDLMEMAERLEELINGMD